MPYVEGNGCKKGACLTNVSRHQPPVDLLLHLTQVYIAHLCRVQALRQTSDDGLPSRTE